MRYAWQLLEEKKRPVITISPDDSALRAAQLMNDAHVGALVVTRGDDVVGILSERDVLRRLVVPRLDPASTPVRAIMTCPVITCSSDTPLDDIRALVRNRRIRHVPRTAFRHSHDRL